MTFLVANGTLDNMFQLMISIFIFIFVLALTYFVTRWIGNYQKVQNKNRNMQVIETMRVANNKYLQIIKVAEVYLVISVCKDSIVTLARLTPEDVEHLQIPDHSAEPDSFQEILKKMKAMKK